MNPLAGLPVLLLITAGSLAMPQAPIMPPVIGGNTVEIQQYPYQAQLWFQGSYSCGASIIGDDWILSTASCMSLLRNVNEASVLVGSATLGEGATHQVDSIHSFPKYNTAAQTYNAGLLKLKNKIVFNNSTQPVAVASAAIQSGATALVSGFGTASEAKDSPMDSTALRALEVPVVSRSLCRLVYHNYDIDESDICAGRNGKSFCTDDWGDPLVRDGELVGLASYFLACGNHGYPGVYTNVAEPSIRDWIYSLTGL